MSYDPEEEVEDKPDYTFDFSEMETTANISEVRQEGNFLIGVTDKGVRFRQRIPQGKILNKVDDKYVLQDMVIA